MDSDSRTEDDDDDRSDWSSNGSDGDDSSLYTEASSQVAVDSGLPMSPGQAAAIIQGLVYLVVHDDVPSAQKVRRKFSCILLNHPRARRGAGWLFCPCSQHRFKEIGAFVV